MNKILVEVFDSETAAFADVSTLREDHAAGDISLYETVLMVKEGTGKITVKQVDEKGPTGTAVGFLSGGLIGLLGGPVGVTVSAAVGGLTGLLFDLFRIIADMTLRIS
jgi:uncharacterized membrane protein